MQSPSNSDVNHGSVVDELDCTPRITRSATSKKVSLQIASDMLYMESLIDSSQEMVKQEGNGPIDSRAMVITIYLIAN